MKKVLLAAALMALAAEAQAQAASAAPSPPASVPVTALTLFFDWDSSTLPPQELGKIEKAVAGFRSRGNARVYVVGHTDSSGTDDYNLMLSLRRANAVRDALVRAGIPDKWIITHGLGERRLRVQTGDDERHPENRRVEIDVF